jgi:hypothetical protein
MQEKKRKALIKWLFKMSEMAQKRLKIAEAESHKVEHN